MSILEASPACFGLMFPFKEERSRNKERLEASLAALCELELLKQRQESRVLSALCLGDAGGRTAWTALRCGADARDGDGLGIQTSSLQCTPWGIMASLEQQVAKLKVNAEVKLTDFPTDLEEGQVPVGESSITREDSSAEASAFHPRFPRSLSAPNGTGDVEPRDTWLSDLTRNALLTDAIAELKTLDPGPEDNHQVQKAETYIFGLIQRKALPPRPSKPRTSLAHDARAVGVVRQSSLCRKEEQHSPKQVPVQGFPEVPTPVVVQVPERIPPMVSHVLDQERFQGTSFTDEAPPPYHQFQPSVQHQPGPYHKPKQAPHVTNQSISLEYQSCRVISTHVDSSNSDPDSPQNFQNYPSAIPKPQQISPPEEHLVNAEYIPAQPCRASTRAYAHHHHHQHSSGKGSGASKPNRNTYSPERPHHHPEQPVAQSQPSRSRSNAKKCRTNEDKNGATRKQGKKASRSQSENSLQRVPERKYNTVERDGAGSGSGSRGSRSSQSKSKKQHQQGNGSYRRWQSSLELSQDEADQPQGQGQVLPTANQRDHCSKRNRKSRPAHPTYAYPNPNHHHHHHHHSHHHQHVEYQVDSRPIGDYHHAAQGESESSTSEADSPDSSSLSSDSDESGGLVWPQQLPPQLSQPSPPAAPGAPLQQKAFVKIKASHALKKKILRFRTGSLKVMTTV